jgi:hypothetical protein
MSFRKLFAAALVVMLGIFLLPFVLLLIMALATTVIVAWDDFSTPDLTGDLLGSGILKMKSVAPGDLFCAFPQRVASLSMLTSTRSPFYGYRANRWRELDSRGVWSIVAISKEAKMLTVYQIASRHTNPEATLDGKVPCGADLTVRLIPGSSRSIIDNVDIKNFPRTIDYGIN